MDPFEVTSLEVNLAQRYSVLVKALDQAKGMSYWAVANNRRGKGYAYLQYNNTTPPDTNSTMPIHDVSGPELDALLVSKDVSARSGILDVPPDHSLLIVSAQSVYPPLGKDFHTSNNVSMSLHSPKPLAAVAYEAVNDDMAAPWPDTLIPGTILVPDKPTNVWNYSNTPADEGVSGVHLDHGLAVLQFVLGDVVELVYQNTVGGRGVAFSRELLLLYCTLYSTYRDHFLCINSHLVPI